MLKEDLNELEKLDKELNRVINDKDLIGAIKSLFMVQDDLELLGKIKELFVKNEKVGIFVGAGISRLINFPSWNELANKSIEYLREQNLINYFECQRIMKEVIDPKQKLTIFDKLIHRETKEAKEFFGKIFSKPDHNKENPYEILVKFNCIKITSNIDNEFFNALDTLIKQIPKASEQTIEKAKKVIDFNGVDLKYIDYHTIYQIHGCIDDLERTVLTTQDYIKAYYEESGLKTFLNHIFNNYTIIFIGYGLEEFPILEHIIGNNENHYVLEGTYFNEMNLFRLKRKYFESLKIEPIPYYLDLNGYYRIIDVLKAWHREIEEGSNKDYYQKIKEIDEVID
jgi:hypothetical protein